MVSDDLRILADWQVEHGLQAGQQDEQADDGRQDRALDENVGEMHGSRPTGSWCCPAVRSAIELSITTLEPWSILLCPAVTTWSPGFRPSVIRTRSPRTSPVFTNRRSIASSPALCRVIGLGCRDHHQHIVAIERIGHRRLRHRYDVFRLAGIHQHIGIHAGQQLAFRIGEFRPDRDHPGRIRHARVGGRDLALEVDIGPGVETRRHRQARRDPPVVGFGHGEIGEDRIDALQPDNRLAGRHIFARRDVLEAGPAVPRRIDGLLRDDSPDAVDIGRKAVALRSAD